MRLSEVCIRRPVFATVMSLMLVLVGAVSYGRLTVREYPNVEEPVVSVSTRYPGASAEIVETQVTQVLEGSIAGIEGIDEMSSSSRPESSRITVRFRSNIDPDVAASDVRDRVSRVRRRLPDTIDEPVIAKADSDSDATLYISFTSDRLNPLELSDYLDRYVVDQFKTLVGVADVRILGERRPAMRIWIDRQALAARNLAIQDVENAINGQNVQVPSGRIESSDREFTVLARTGLDTPEEFARIVISRENGYLVRLGDVARVEIGAADDRRFSRTDGRNSVSVGIVKTAVANPLDVSQAVRAVMPSVRASLPEGMNADISYDSSVFIERSIHSVYSTIIEAVVLVCLVIFIFLRSFRASLIPMVTIPVSLVATFAVMYAFGFSINTLTLLACVLAIGLVVDDAIVVLENVHRHIENGMSRLEAAIVGAKEIGFAVVAMTLTLTAVYAPLAFATGRTGRLFIEFALSLAGSVLISGFLALTLTPMMCSKLLRHQASHGTLYNLFERGFSALFRGYRRLLTASLSARPLVVLGALGVACLAGFLYAALPRELAPTEDRGVVVLRGTAPEGATIEFTERYARQAEPILAAIPEVRSYFVVGGFPQVTNAFAIGRLVNWEERDRSQQAIVAGLSRQLATIPGMNFFASNPPAFGVRGGGRPISYVVETSGTYEELGEMVDALMRRMQADPDFLNVDSDLVLNQPQLDVQVNRDKILDTGLQVETVGRTLQTLLGGRTVTRFERGGDQYDVILQLAPDDRRTPQDLSDIFVRGANGEMIQLANLVSVEETVAPKELNRFNQFRAATLSANLAPGVSLGAALDKIDRMAAEVLPQNARTDLKGESREFRTSGSSLVFVFGLSLLFIYLVLSAQFESFRDPLIIMVSVPLSMTGALAALYLTGSSLNVYSQIGLVTLIGLITKHGILIVEFANQLRDRGASIREAVIESASLRLRPILMTTGAMVLGALPLALASGAGAEGRHAIGWVIVGGMSVGTVLTLFVVPTVYSLLTGRTRATATVAQAQPAE